MFEQVVNVIAITITVAIPLAYILHHRSKNKSAREKLNRSAAAGLTEPFSLHPKISPNLCIGIGACLRACPEGEILGVIDGRVQLVSPTKCIGHGACQSACPTDAIDLVFGTERRGVEIPYIKSTFETNVGGIYIAGELGGMGLIRNAMTQGKQAVQNITQTLAQRDPAVYDVAIIGAGPAGLAATLQAEKDHLRYLTLEQDDVGGTILTYPRQKLVMTEPMDIPLFGKFKYREIRKEELLQLWYEIVRRSGVGICTKEKLENVQRQNGHFIVTSSKGQYLAKRILLAIGRRGTPRKLDVPGERSTKVAYKLIEPEQYRQRAVLVVGGGDSAVEAALSLSEQPGTEVTISYRRAMFSRIKEKNQARIEQAIRAGAVRALYKSNVLAIKPESVLLEWQGREQTLANDCVFIFAGGELPTKFLQKLGIQIEKKYGER